MQRTVRFLGCTLTRYDVTKGLATYNQDPLPGHAVCSLFLARRRKALFTGTSVDADCQSRPPDQRVAILARFDAATLELQASTVAPAGMLEVRVVGPMGRQRWLCTGLPEYNPGGDRRETWFNVDFDRLRSPADSDLREFPRPLRRIEYAGRPGLFVILSGGVLELWDLNRGRRVRQLADHFSGYSFRVQGCSLYLLDKKKITVLEHCLR